MPTDDEIDDNVVAYWCPAKPTQAGDRIALSYRLHWLADRALPDPARPLHCHPPRPRRTARPAAPRRRTQVHGRVPGRPARRAAVRRQARARSVVLRGKFSYVYTEAVPDDVPGHWRAQFDLTVDGHDPVEIRLFLRANDQVLTETWLYQYHPFPTDARPVGFDQGVLRRARKGASPSLAGSRGGSCARQRAKNPDRASHALACYRRRHLPNPRRRRAVAAATDCGRGCREALPAGHGLK